MKSQTFYNSLIFLATIVNNIPHYLIQHYFVCRQKWQLAKFFMSEHFEEFTWAPQFYFHV